MERLVKDLSQSVLVSQNFLDPEVETVKGSLASFLNLVPKYRSTLRVRQVTGCVVFNAIKQFSGWSRAAVQSTSSSKTTHVHSRHI